MRTVIDRAGRIVVPKPLRQAPGLKPGQPLEVRAGDGRLEIEIAPTPRQLKKRGKGWWRWPKSSCRRSRPNKFATRWSAYGDKSR
jgi:AbrB family looped-hinge helix DNA binding protein